MKTHILSRLVCICAFFALLLCGCSIEISNTPTTQQPDVTSDAPEAESSTAELESSTPEPAQEDTTAAPLPSEPEFSEAAEASLKALRAEISQTTAVFGVAYVGYYEDNGVIDFNQWFESTTAPLIDAFPFFAEIDEAHFVGTQGHLYCITPLDSLASLAVKRGNETLYSSESGTPILLFADESGDTSITLTAPDGSIYEYAPMLDETGAPELLIADDRDLLSYPFSATLDVLFDVDAWLNEGWLGITAFGLAGSEEGISWSISTWDESAHYTLHFYPNGSDSYDGEAVLECCYGDDATVQAQWQGWWRIEEIMDRPSKLELDLMLMDGADKASFEDATVISEVYQLMIDPSGERLMLIASTLDSVIPIIREDTCAAELSLVYD